jgi:hypothetical protein
MARLFMAVVWTLTIIALCVLPGFLLNQVEKKTGIWIPYLDKLVHAGIFVVFSILWLRVGSSRSRYFWIAVGGLALAAGTELAQNLPIVGRDGNLPDTLTDALGVIVGLAIARFVEPLARFFESRVFRQATATNSSLTGALSNREPATGSST